MGIAIRTKKPLNLHLAPTVWKQIVNIQLATEDIEEVDVSLREIFVSVLLSVSLFSISVLCILKLKFRRHRLMNEEVQSLVPTANWT